MLYFYLFIAFLFIVLLIIAKLLIALSADKKRVEKELAETKIKKFSSPGTVKNLSILPLVEYYAEGGDLKTEAGVSYYVKADDFAILLDTGANEKKEHPSPLLYNMEKLGISPDDVDAFFISHLHRDHVGGIPDEKRKTFSLSGEYVNPGDKPVYSPEAIMPSSLNPGPEPVHVSRPVVIKEGVASIGPIPRALFIMGYTLEHSLAVNLEGKGIALIIGCGHPSIERIIERTKMLFDEPIYAIVGGLHYPVNGGRMNAGPLNLQNIAGSDRPFWNGLDEDDVESAIGAIREVNPQIVGISPHDSSDWTIERFKEAFGDKYREVKVGAKIVL